MATYRNISKVLNLPTLSASPSSGVNGEMYFNTTDLALYIYDGAWKKVTQTGPHTVDATVDFTLADAVPSATGYYGYAVASSNSYTAIGRPAATNIAEATTPGRCYVYNNSDGTLKHTITNPNTSNQGSGTAGDRFGVNVSCTDTYILVGADYEYTSALSGRAYLYNAASGALVYTFNDPSPATNRYFGRSVSVSDTYSLVSSLGSNKAYLFTNSNGSLSQTFTGSDDYAWGECGVATSQYGSHTYSAIGNYGYNYSTTGGRIFLVNNSTGATEYTINNPDTSGYKRFGSAVACNETHFAGSDNKAAGDLGKVYVYSTTTGSLVHTISNPRSANYQFGFTLDMSDTQLIVGQYNTGDSATKAYVYSLSSGNLEYTLDNPVSGAVNYAYSVGISSRYAVVGAYKTDVGATDSGSAYIY